LEADLAGLAQHRGQPSGRGQRIGRAEAGKGACLGDELGGQHGPHAGQATDEGRIRVALEQLGQVAVELQDALAAGQGLGGQLADQPGGQSLPRDRQLLGHRGGKGPVGKGPVGKGLDLTGRQPTGGLQMVDQPLAAGGADLGGG
jgi:hypothetical protein